MTFKTRLIAAGVAGLLAAGSIAAAATTAPTTPQAAQESSKLRSQPTDQIGRMIEHCNRMMSHWSE